MNANERQWGGNEDFHEQTLRPIKTEENKSYDIASIGAEFGLYGDKPFEMVDALKKAGVL